MSDEELRRAMEFIVSQQAESAERMRRADRRMDRLERILKLAIRAGVRTRREVREQIAALADAHIGNEDRFAAVAEAQMRNEERFAALVESQSHTDRRLDALIDIVRGQQGRQS